MHYVLYGPFIKQTNRKHLSLTEEGLPMVVTQAGRAKRWIALVSVHGRLRCAVDLSCLPLKDNPGRRGQTLSGRASTIGSPTLRTKRLCHGTCMTRSCITVTACKKRGEHLQSAPSSQQSRYSEGQGVARLNASLFKQSLSLI